MACNETLLYTVLAGSWQMHFTFKYLDGPVLMYWNVPVQVSVCPAASRQKEVGAEVCAAHQAGRTAGNTHLPSGSQQGQE